MRHPVCILIFFIILSGHYEAIAENGTVRDSLDAMHSAMPDDTLKVKRMMEFTEIMEWTDVNLAVSYATQALRLSEELNYTWGLAHSKYSLSYLFKDSDFRITETLILEALEHATALNDSVLIGRIYNTIGNLKDNVNETDDAIRYYHKALEVFDLSGNDSLKSKVYNNLGIIYDNLGDFDRSLEYYRKASELNERNHNFSALAINYLNIGYSQIMSGNLDSATHYLELSHGLATKYDYRRILPYIYNNFSEYHYKRKDFQSAIDFALKGESAAKQQVNLLQEKQALMLQKDTYLANNQLYNAFQCSEKINVISDSITSYNKLKEIDLLEMRYAFEQERKQRELEQELLKAEIGRKELTLLLIVVGSGLLILLFVFLFFIQKNRIRRKNLEQKNILLEKEKLARELELKEKELEFKSKELTTNVMYLLKKNEFIASISNKLKNTNLAQKGRGTDAIDKIIRELDRSVSEDNWTDFEVRFQEVHVDFYNKLSRQFPDLTPNELRLCAFLRLNMTSKEIASITFQSTDSLKVARHRLRKKLGMDRDENLVAFLTQI